MSELILGMKSARMAADAKLQKNCIANMDISCMMVLEMLDAIESLQSQLSEAKAESGWISADTDIPNDSGRYLVNVNGFGVRVDRYTKSEDVNGWLKYFGYVTHWMPLPSPPKQGEE